MPTNNYIDIMEKNHMEIPWHDYAKADSNVLIAEAKPWNDLPFSCDICVPPLATVSFRYDKLLPASAEIDETTADEAADA